MVAYGVLDAVRAAGFRVPEDYSVCGFDKIFPSHFLPVGLTTVEHYIVDKGRNAFEMLHAKLSGETSDRRHSPAWSSGTTSSCAAPPPRPAPRPKRPAPTRLSLPKRPRRKRPRPQRTAASEETAPRARRSGADRNAHRVATGPGHPRRRTRQDRKRPGQKNRASLPGTGAVLPRRREPPRRLSACSLPRRCPCPPSVAPYPPACSQRPPCRAGPVREPCLHRKEARPLCVSRVALRPARSTAPAPSAVTGHVQHHPAFFRTKKEDAL